MSHRMHSEFRISSRLLRALPALILASSLAAQPAPAPTRGEVVNLDRFVVHDATVGPETYRVAGSTSGFRVQAVADTPFSVGVFSSELMLDQQARSLLDVVKNDPSIAPAGDPLWFDRVNVRGFYLSVNAVFRDGLGINDQGTIALDNKEAVEVAKGLSALRNGVTSPGGAVNYVVKRPTVQPLTRFGFTADGHGGYGGTLDVSRRFGPNNRFGVRVNAAAEEIRSFVDPVEGDRKFISAAFDFRVSPRLRLEADLERHDKTISSAPSPSLTSFANIAAARAFFPQLNATTRPSQPWAMEPNVQTYISGRAAYALGHGWQLRVATHRSVLDRDQRSVRAVNIRPNGEYDVAHYFAPDQQRNNTAWQVALDGDFVTGVLRHQVVLGYDFVRRDMVYGDAFSQNIGTSNLFSRTFISDPRPTVAASYLASRSDQDSAFVVDTIRFAEAWHFFGGARLTRLNNFNGTPTGLSRAYDKKAVNPTAGLVYKPLQKLSLYASYAEGIEQGGTAPISTVNARQVMDPLESDQLEVGAKFELARGALLTAALFRIDKGLEFIDAPTNTYVQNGRQVHEGAEITVGGPLTSRLRVIAGLAWLEAKVERTANPTLVGKRPQGVPEWQSNVFGDYDLSTWVPGLAVNAGLYYVGAKPVDQLNTWSASRSLRADAGVRYRQRWGDRQSITYRATFENVGDVRYLNDTSFGSLVFGAPFTAKFSATWDF
jgi:iron complex outermembrane receptor protein